MTQDERVLAIGAAFGPILKAAFPNASAFERMAVTDALATEVEKRTGWFAQEPGSKGGWQSIESAPRDGSWFIADGGGLDRPTPMKWCERVGAWEADAVMLEDWDNQAEGYSRPLLWFAIPNRSTTPSQGLDAATAEPQWCGGCKDTRTVDCYRPKCPMAKMDAATVERAFKEALWAGWNSGRAGETMTNIYAQRTWEASDTHAALATDLHQHGGKGA